MNYLNETVYVDTDLKNNVPVGTIGEYVELDESETAKMLYKRLNKNRASGNYLSIIECTEYAKDIREGQLSEYLVESVKNNLPAWNQIKALPPDTWDHIKKRHTMKGRFPILMKQYGSFVEAKFGNKTYNRVKKSIPEKFESGAEFDKIEEEVLEYMKYWCENEKDHFLRSMSERQIIQAIREAYEDAAAKISKRSNPPAENLPDGSKMSREIIKYQGVTRNNLIIHFKYDFENECIITAYPIFLFPKTVRKDKLPK